MRFFYKCIHLLARVYFLLFFRLQVQGTEYFRPGAAIIASNHTSFFDPPVLAVSCPEEVHFLAKASLFKIPFLGRMIRALNAHPVSHNSFRTLQKVLSEGKKVILFPEGKRSQGDFLPLEKGMAHLSQKGRCPILPVYIEGASSAWPVSRRLPKLFGKISVTFGAAIEWEENSDQKEITDKVGIAIQALKNAAKRI